MNLEIGRLRAGDVIFVQPGSSAKQARLRQTINVQGQRVLAALRRQDRIRLTDRLPKHSHVMLGLGGGNIIHADGRTVALEGLEEALQTGADDAGEFSIFRHTKLDSQDRENIASEAIRYLRQEYDFTEYLRPQSLPEGRDSTQFCSRLVATAYSKSGVTISELPDHRVLPVDLWRVCQNEEWSEVTGEFISEIDWKMIGQALGPIDVPGHGKMDLAAFIDRADGLERKVAGNIREIEEAQRTAVDDLLRVEALLTQYAIALLDTAKATRIDPSLIDDYFADMICKVLPQLPALIALGKLGDLREVLTSAPILMGVMDDPHRSAYAGFPAHAEIMELREVREKLLIMSYLLMAETGLGCFCAHATKAEKFAIFATSNSAHAEKFFDATPDYEDDETTAVEDSDFRWISNASDRNQCIKFARNIIALWQIKSILKSSAENQDTKPT